MRPKICLNMIVKNEAARITRCLESVVPHIDYWVIYDTGSTDGTPKCIEDFFDGRGIPGEIHIGQFKNFEQARNDALAFARASAFAWDYLLLTDADMELVVEDKNFRDGLTLPAYNVIQKGGTLVYYNRRLIARSTTGKYVGVTHEYLDIPGDVPLHGIYFKDHADGANRKNKFKRDIMLLLNALKKEPNNRRYQFYLAQSYSDMGNHKGAITAYRKRLQMGGWVEETYISQMRLATNLLATGDDAGFIRTLLEAYNSRPSRAEAPFELAHYYRLKGMNAASVLFSEPMLSLPYPSDTLFINHFIHEVGIREEFSICAFYDQSKRAHGFKVCNDLALDTTDYKDTRNLARNNLLHYLEPISKMAPSFQPRRLEFTPSDATTFEPTGYALLNPSVALVNKELYTVIRTVNYDIDKDGRYLIKHTETGEITNDNPIHTRNYLAKLSEKLEIQTVSEILPPLLPKPEYPLVVGFEDMRLFEFHGDMWTSSTMRELNREGWCEQVLAKIDRSTKQPHIVEWHKMDDTAVRQHEKNWMPWVKDGAIRFAYHVNEIVDDYGKLVSKMPLSFAVDQFRGGSQVIPFHGGWLALVHEAGQHDNKRYYQHRFVWFCYNGLIQYISLPFVFHSKQIEFAAGLAWHPDEKRLVISYGVADKEAWVATVDDHDIMEMLHG